MKNLLSPSYTVWFALAACVSAAPAAIAAIDFNRQVRPILSDKCFRCHGPDESSREARLRLDLREVALQPAKSGEKPIVPGHPDISEVLLRVTDEFEPMPPVETGKTITPAEVEILRQWIAEGAQYAAHWAFVPPSEPPAPHVKTAGWARNPIDGFVLAHLELEELRPAREADRATLLRRVSFDLTGLPPSSSALDAFLTDPAPDAYERAVDALLAAPAYGERMATDWLDAARYADTNGFFRDDIRQIWPWRDWVVRAFNRNMPFDQFTVEQLAGDLLPNPSPEQRIATGFNRNHMVTGEGGVIDEEYRVEYVADRLETTSTVWLGLTVACARCHDHKFDPISQKDYYQLFAFFNSGVEKGQIRPVDPPPVMDVTSPRERKELERLMAARKTAKTALDRMMEPLKPAMTAWEQDTAAKTAVPDEGQCAYVDFEAEAASGPPPQPGLPRAVEKGGVYREDGVLGQSMRFDGMQHLELPAEGTFDADQPWSIGLWVKGTGQLSCVLSKIEPTGGRRGMEIIWQKSQIGVNLVDRWVVSAIEVSMRDPLRRQDWSHVIVSYDGTRKSSGLKIFVDGREAPLNILRDSLQGSIANHEPIRIARRDSGLGFYGQLDELRIFRRAMNADEARAWFWSERLRGIFATAPEKRGAAQQASLLEYYIESQGSPASRQAYHSAAAATQDEERYRARLPKTLVMEELASPPESYVLKRGQYDSRGDRVHPDVPAALPGMSADAPRNRLGLAQWLVSPEHPLTARVAVNRLWAQCFGEGLTSTINDFGSQGELPSHPELLDWLAVRFRSDGWDIKGLLRLIVTSATYRQSSTPTPELLQRDPANRLLARGPRFRLGAEMIRDQALAVSGLLVPRLGGPPVKPYQPPGLWEAVSYDGELTYEVDRGDGLWRRTLYSLWKRQSPPPGVLLFDGPTREVCAVKRPRTNTPLQALHLLNDETYVEAARAMAADELERKADRRPVDQRLADLFRRTTARPPTSNETAALKRLLEKQQARFAAAPDAARKLVDVGFAPNGRALDPVELASWTVVAQTLLNLDETVTRR